MAAPQSIGRYEVESVIGAGASGVVYLARDPVIDRRIALKVLHADLATEKRTDTRERFLREARAAGRLAHPNIVTIFDVGEDAEAGPFIAMEYVEGRTLKEILASGARYGPGRAAKLAATLARALGSAHAQGVVHRDVKPANVILTADGGVKITDFGIARLDASDLTTEGSILGTPNYMSPEQIKGLPADRRSDLYAVGVILFELVTGQRPFHASSLPELSIRVANEPAPDPLELCPTLPHDLSEVIRRCLEKDPARRFQSGLDLAETLAAASDGSPEELPEGIATPGEDSPLVHTLPTSTSPPAESPGGDSEPGGGGRPGARILEALARPRSRWLTAGLGVVLLLAVAGLLRDDRLPPPSTASDPAAGFPAEATPVIGAAEPVHVPPPTPVPPVLDSTLRITHRNRMTEAFISAWVDGDKVWTERMTAPKNVFKRLRRFAGLPVEATIPVAAGRHTIEVHVSGLTMKVEARASIEGDLPRGGSRTLKVEVNPYSDRIELSWQD